MAHFLDIPPELIIHILSYLSLPDLVSASQIHSIVHTCTTTSQILQYPFAAQAAGVKDNPLSSHSTLERLAILKSSEDRWTQPQVDFRQTIPVEPGHISVRYDATSGIYFCVDDARTTLHYCKLPSNASDVPTWSSIHVGHTVLQIGFSIYEHDLIAILTITPHATVAGHQIIEVMLLQFSTGGPHPLADNHIIFVQELTDAWAHFHLPFMEISGHHLALSTGFIYTSNDGAVDDLYVYDWIDTSIKLKTSGFLTSFLGFVFLSSEYILLANPKKWSVDIWHLDSHDPPQPPSKRNPLLSLGLPRLHRGTLMLELSCEASSTTFADTPYSPRPFHTPAKKRMITFKILFANPQLDGLKQTSFFIHSGALFDLIDGGKRGSLWWQSWGPPITRCLQQPENANFWKTVSAGQRCLVLSGGTMPGSPGLQRMELRLLDFNKVTVNKLLEERNRSCPRDDASTRSVRSRPPEIAGRLAAKTIRMVKSFSDLFKSRSKVRHDTRNMEQREQRDAYQKEQNSAFAVSEHSRLKCGAFGRKFPVESMLPYVSIPCQLEGMPTTFSGIMMDEERLVATLSDNEGRLAEIHVLHIGASDCQAVAS